MAVPHSRLAFGAEWEITCALPLKIKTKNKPAPFQIEKSHQHPETGWGGPKNPPVQLCWEAREVVGLPQSKCHFLGLLGWWWGQEWPLAGEETFLQKKYTPESWYPTAFCETSVGFYLPRPCPKLCSLSRLALQDGNDSSRPKTSWNGSFRLCLKKKS